MASFTDTNLPQFNPYIPQLPIEAMVKVGAYKQQKYEEGFTKIQNQIDQVSGLDLIKGVHKEYLQSKLDELGNNLKSVAAGDFSNFQLVNSVGGMARQIGKDPTVQSAVSSTAKYRKEQARLENLRKQGKSSANREFDFNNEANSWLNDGKLETSFDGQMKEHIDVNKKVLDVIQKLHPNANLGDHPYVINKDGSIDYKTFANIMQKQGIKGVDEGQIKTAVNSVLDANDYDELASQGRYNYKDYDASNLQSLAKMSYDASKSDYTRKLNRLEKQLLLTNDISQQLEINKSIDYYKSLLGDDKVPGALDESYKSTLESISSAPDKARANLYTRNWLDQIANGFAYKEVTDEVLANPGRADFWEGEKYKFDVIKEQNSEKWKKDASNLAWTAEKRLQKKDDREAIKDAKEALGSGAYFVGSGDPTTDNLEAASNFSDYMASLSAENVGILNELANLTATPGVKADPDQVLKKIELYKNNDPNGQPRNAAEKDLFDRYIQNSNTKVTQQKIYNDLEAKAYEKIAGAKTEKAAIDNELKNRGDLVTTLPSGQKVKFSAKEVLAYLQKEESYTDDNGITTLGIDESKLNDTEKLIKQALNKRYTTYSGSINPAVDAYLGKFAPLSVRDRNLKSKVSTEVANGLAGITGSFKTEQAAVTFKDANEKNRFIAELTNIAGANLNIKVAGQKYTPKELIESLKNKNADDIEIQTVRKGNKYFINVLDKKDPKGSQQMPVTESFVALNPSLGESYLNKGMDLANQTLRNNGTTNIYHDYDHAYYHSGMIGGNINNKRTVTFPVVADLDVIGGNFYPVLRMKVPSMKKAIELPFYDAADYSLFPQYLQSLTNDKLIKLFKRDYPNIEQLISR
ncbi:MAG: hypothetical protein EB127_01405 [Alphaproteobacteria bacterium]|nr:hypothetical protein [Alphaproteobacteria bacterium]